MLNNQSANSEILTGDYEKATFFLAAAENQALKGLRGFLEEGLSDGRVVVATRESALSSMK